MSTDMAVSSVLHVRALGITVAIEVADDALVEPLERRGRRCSATAARGSAGAHPRPPAEGADRTGRRARVRR